MLTLVYNITITNIITAYIYIYILCFLKNKKLGSGHLQEIYVFLRHLTC